MDGYLHSIRNMPHGSIANHITSAINVMKFRRSEMPDHAAFDCPDLAQLKRRRNQEQTLGERGRQWGSEQNGLAILWEDVRLYRGSGNVALLTIICSPFLEAVRCQREIVSDLSADNDVDPIFARESPEILDAKFVCGNFPVP